MITIPYYIYGILLGGTSGLIGMIASIMIHLIYLKIKEGKEK